MLEHTPWHIENEPHNVWDARGMLVCRVPGMGFDDPAIAPTARLIAAAPELLHVLEEIVANQAHVEGTDDEWCWFQDAKDVIAKAKWIEQC